MLLFSPFYRGSTGNSGTAGRGPLHSAGGGRTVQHHHASLWLYGLDQSDLWRWHQQGPTVFHEELHAGPRVSAGV